MLDYDDDINDIHICVDRRSIHQFRKELLNEVFINGQPTNMPPQSIKLDFDCSEFPNNNPKHTDVGFEDLNRDYKSSINVYNALTIVVGHSENIIATEVSTKILQITTNSTNLEQIASAILTSEKMAYVYDNYIPINTQIESSFHNARLIIWAGNNGDILYH